MRSGSTVPQFLLHETLLSFFCNSFPSKLKTLLSYVSCTFTSASLSCESMGWRYTWFVISFFFFFGIGYTLYVQSKEVLEVRLGCVFVSSQDYQPLG